MGIEELKKQINDCTRTSDGRLRLSTELRCQIAETLAESGLCIKEFSALTGLSKTTVYKVKNRLKQVRRPVLKGKKSLFKEIIVTPEALKYVITGPSGMRLEMQSVEEISVLWRSLC
jgi:phosphosulfolactate synthase (CoM biosynthesis protein A)